MSPTKIKNVAVVGSGMAGVACARTLLQAGHRVTLFEKSDDVGGRMTTRSTAFGSFDYGTQYFTVRDQRFMRALQTAPALCKPWSANTVRLLDEFGQIAAAAPPPTEAHWVPTPAMSALLSHWAAPLLEQHRVELGTQVIQVQDDALHAARWQLQTQGPGGARRVFSGFDAVLLTTPPRQAAAVLPAGTQFQKLLGQLATVEVAPCWTLMLAFPQAMQPGLSALGPQWNAARSTHHRIAWLARESSKPARGAVERWTVQASPAWSLEHLQDEAPRVQAKLQKAFAEVTGIRAQPAYAQVHCWRFAQTLKPLGKSHLWLPKAGIGVGGDWCLGHRAEDAFISGLELALAVA